MPHTIRFVLTLHNHQPIGNFDGVFEQSYQDSYLPFLDVLDEYPTLPVALHTSGSLMEWLVVHHPEYVERLAQMVIDGRCEIVGGSHFEAILTMLPRRDRIGQIRSYSDWLEEHLGARVRGMWIPERVWEPGLVSDLVDAGIEYIILDDFHLRGAGLEDKDLHGYYVTEDEGRLLKVFPGSERLRYLIPFGSPEATVDYLRGIAEQQPGAVMVFGDDGEKFGTWPDTKQHVYEDRWLHHFCQALLAQKEWLKVTTLAESIDHLPPVGKVYIPNASYREMTEWSLPAERLMEYEHLHHDMEHDHRWATISKFTRGGLWRNFKIKYPETDEMYSRMLMISQRLEALERQGYQGELVDSARQELYRGQCNCGYWHGAFGGMYLPHLRNAVFNHLIAAENILDQVEGIREESRVTIEAGDYNHDARQEVKLANQKLIAFFAPSQGGMMYELDIRSICLNLLASLTRHPEAYHQKVLAGPNANQGEVASIHDRVVFKQEGLDQKLLYDTYPRKSLVDHFYDTEISQMSVADCSAMERGDFAGGVYETRMRRSAEHVQIEMSRKGNAWGHPFTVTKRITLPREEALLRIDYELTDLPPNHPLHFGVEFNFAAMPSGADDRYFFNQQDERLGQLGSHLDLVKCPGIGLRDEWLGLGVELHLSRPSGIWTFPIETVSQSEAGFELVHQSVALQPHWILQGNAEGKWSVSMELRLDTSLAEKRDLAAKEVSATT
ncbi:Retaining alpha-glucosidase [Planctomycetales bacterium 10988]|nr:Retaining alpha-glucosidase [Planctomycetales bacterium 10988]